MLNREQVDQLFDHEVYSSQGERIGRVRRVYADDISGVPDWMTVSTGLFGTKETYVLLTDAEIEGKRVTVPYTKEFVKHAPNVPPEEHLSPEEERELYGYYSHPDHTP